jgi:hypothetical protein
MHVLYAWYRSTGMSITYRGRPSRMYSCEIGTHTTYKNIYSMYLLLYALHWHDDVTVCMMM